MNRIFIPFFSIYIILSLTIAPVTGQNDFTGITHNFNMLPDYEFESYVKAPLIWEADSNKTVQVSFSLLDVPDEISGVNIDALTFATYITDNPNDVGNQVDYNSQVPNEKISELNQEKFYNQSIKAPLIGDNFYLNVTIYARTTGNVTQGEVNTYSYRFPEGDTIFVSHESDLVPLINLYGFPPGSFFSSWLPVYMSVLIILLAPAFVRLAFWIKDDFRKEENIDE